jgi:hypothetical protein
MLDVLITTQMAKDPSASERMRQQNIGNSVFPPGTGIFVAGETRDMTLTGIDSGSELAIALGTPSEQNMTERERLLEFVERQEKQVELMTPHCHLEIDAATKQ